MIYEISNSPDASEPISLQLAKSHCKILNNNDDELLQIYISAARAYAEGVTGKFYSERHVELFVEKADINYGLLTLPKPARQILAATIQTKSGVVDISTKIYLLNSQTIQFDALPADGFGIYIKYSSSAAVEPTIIQAILILIGHFYENRQETTAENIKLVPLAATALLNQKRHGVM